MLSCVFVNACMCRFGQKLKNPVGFDCISNNYLTIQTLSLFYGLNSTMC